DDRQGQVRNIEHRSIGASLVVGVHRDFSRRDVRNRFVLQHGLAEAVRQNVLQALRTQIADQSQARLSSSNNSFIQSDPVVLTQRSIDTAGVFHQVAGKDGFPL